MKCPHCGGEIETQQNRAAASRWEGMTPEQRSREMKRVRKKGLVGAGGKKRRAKK
jgi:CRP-like cAMP-binding protein